jgi:hypothetical protein
LLGIVAGGASGLLAAEPPSVATPPAVALGRLTLTPHLSDRLRIEIVDWFDPGPAAAPNDNHDYSFVANVLHFGGRLAHPRFTLYADGQYVAVLGLPDDAGGLGPGAVYFASNRDDDPHELFLREGWVRVPDLLPGLSVQRGGRFAFDEGLETIARTTDPMLAWVKKLRISQRLLGTFDYTHSGRSFDGGVVTYDRGPYNLTLMGGKPTRGGFNVSANPHIEGIYTVYVAGTVTEPTWLPRADARFFYDYYADQRGLTATDNRGAEIRAADAGADIEIHTFGANLTKIWALGPGDIDTMVWGASQTGSWQSLDHAAWALAVEGGYRFAHVPWTPWLRAGYFRGSGDNDPADGDHGTFFQLLPTARLYALTPFYNLMNNQDVFAQAIVKPLAALLVRTDYHYLEATERHDLIYAGGGATHESRLFGYAGFPARGARALAHHVDLTVAWTVNRHVQVSLYYGHAFGQDVIDRQFAGSQHLDYAYLETTLTW